MWKRWADYVSAHKNMPISYQPAVQFQGEWASGQAWLVSANNAQWFLNLANSDQGNNGIFIEKIVRNTATFVVDQVIANFGNQQIVPIAVGTKIYIFGKNTLSTKATVTIYDTVAGTFSALIDGPAVPVGTVGVICATVLPSGNIMLALPTSLVGTNLAVFNTTTNTYSATVLFDFAAHGVGIDYLTCQQSTGLVLIVWGYSPGATNQWTWGVATTTESLAAFNGNQQIFQYTNPGYTPNGFFVGTPTVANDPTNPEFVIPYGGFPAGVNANTAFNTLNVARAVVAANPVFTLTQVDTVPAGQVFQALQGPSMITAAGNQNDGNVYLYAVAGTGSVTAGRTANNTAQFWLYEYQSPHGVANAWSARATQFTIGPGADGFQGFLPVTNIDPNGKLSVLTQSMDIALWNVAPNIPVAGLKTNLLVQAAPVGNAGPNPRLDPSHLPIIVLPTSCCERELCLPMASSKEFMYRA